MLPPICRVETQPPSASRSRRPRAATSRELRPGVGGRQGRLRRPARRRRGGDGWMLASSPLANSDPAIGMAAPMSNDAPPHQRVEPGYGDENGLRRFAGGGARAPRQWFTPPRLGPVPAGEAQGPGAAGVSLVRRDLSAGPGGRFAAAVARDLFVHRVPAGGPRRPAGAPERIVPLSRRDSCTATATPTRCGPCAPTRRRGTPSRS